LRKQWGPAVPFCFLTINYKQSTTSAFRLYFSAPCFSAIFPYQHFAFYFPLCRFSIVFISAFQHVSLSAFSVWISAFCFPNFYFSPGPYSFLYVIFATFCG
jgi:hypothetical protein